MKKKIERILVRTLLVVLGLLVIVVAVRTWADVRAQKKLDQAWRSLGRAKIVVSLRTLLPPIPNEEDNAARIWKAAENIFLLEADARAVLRRVEQALQEGKTPDPAGVAAVDALVVRNRLALDLVRAAVAKSVFRYNRLSPRDYDRPWDLKNPNILALLQGLRLIRTKAALEAESGRTAEALDLWTTGTRLLLLMRRDLSLIGSLALVGGMKSQIPMLNRIVAGRDLAEKDLRVLIDFVRPEPWKEEFEFAIRFEAAFESQLFGKLIEDPETAPDWVRESLGRGLRGWLLRPILKSAAAWSAANLEKVAPWADLAPHEIKDYIAVISGETESPIPRSFRLYFGRGVDDSLPSITELKSYKFRFDLLSAWLTAARLGIAGRIHFLRHGAYPATLAELDKDILGALPVDPYTGRPFIFKVGPEGFVVYSVGPNGRDEEGRCAGSLRPTSLRETDDDCVWTETRPSPRKPVGR
jgi:hypothetical protein